MFKRKKNEANELVISPLHKIITLGLIAFFAYAVINEKDKQPQAPTVKLTIDNVAGEKQANIIADYNKTIELELTAADIKTLALEAAKQPNVLVFKLKIEQNNAAFAPAPAAAPEQKTNTTATP